MRIATLVLVSTLLATPGVASAQGLPAAEAFVAKLYRAYQTKPGPDYVGRQARAVFTADLVALMRRSAASVPKDEVPPLDGDPICDCQDYEIEGIQVSVTAAGPGRADAVASFTNAGQPTTIRLDLIAQRGAWRVADVHSPSTPTLVGFLRDSLKP